MNNGNPWRPEEDALLISVWPMLGSRCAHMFPGRTLLAIRWRVKFLSKVPEIKQVIKRNFKLAPGHRKGMTKAVKRTPAPRRDRTIANSDRSRDGVPMVVSVWQYAERVGA